jgi:hypothetical protein
VSPNTRFLKYWASSDLGTFYGALEPLDMFRHAGPNARALTLGNGHYFSIDCGATNLASFNGTAGGDLSDWAGYTIDAFNAAAYSGVLLPISSADITALDVIGYDLNPGLTSTSSPSGSIIASNTGGQLQPVPEPGSLGLLIAVLLGFGLFRRNRTPG